MKGNTKERVGWQLLQYCCEVRLAPNHALYVTFFYVVSSHNSWQNHVTVMDLHTIYYWGEPERAPLRRVECSQSIIICIYMVRPSPTRRYIHCTATRNIFRRSHEETSAFSGTTCIIIAESAKQIALVSEPVSRKAKWLQTLIAMLVMLLLYLKYLPICLIVCE